VKAGTLRAAHTAVGLVIAAVTLWLVFRTMEWSAAAEAFRNIRADLAVLLVSCVAAGTLLRSFLWTRLAGRFGPAPYGLALRALLVGFLANNVLPARLGEVARSGLWALRTGIGQGPALGVLAVERSLDLVVLGLLALAVLPTAPVDETARNVLSIGAASGVAVAVGLAFLSRVRLQGMGRLSRIVSRLVEGLAVLGRPREIARPLLLTAVIWCSTLLYQATALAAFGIEVPFSAATLLLVCSQLAVAIPSAPSFAGPYHYAVYLALVAYGVDRHQAGAFAIFHGSLVRRQEPTAPLPG
jgi:uncharacterized membrane protein YbhN (UPF0104 family)